MAEQLDQTGLAIDFRELKGALAEVLDLLDHRNLNELPVFQAISPTAENISHWIFQELAKRINRPGVGLGRVAVGESPGNEAVYREA